MVYQPKNRFNVPLMLYIPQYNKALGTVTKEYTEDDNYKFQFFASVKTYGGTETQINGLLVIERTAIIETYYTPKITADCQIKNLINNHTYEILGDVENIDFCNQFLRFKVKTIGGC